jgi:dihydrofolate reductase
MSDKKLEVVIVAAVSNNNVIGNLEMPEIFVPFKNNIIRMDKARRHICPRIIGRRTYELLKTLKEDYELLETLFWEKPVIILSRNRKFENQKVIVCHSIEQALQKAGAYGEMAYVMGGEKICEQMMALGFADRLELTKIHRYVGGKNLFPVINLNEWEQTHNENHNDHSYLTYVRKQKLETAENP